MKNYTTLSIICLLCVCHLNAQQVMTVERQSDVSVNVSGNYKSVQWEISTDNNAFYPLPDATDSKYVYKASAPAFLRARLVSQTDIISYSETTQVLFENKTYLKTIKSSGGHAYAETADGKPTTGVNIQEDRGSDGNLRLTAVSNNWTNQNTCIAWYLYQTIAEYDIDIVLNITKGKIMQFELSMIDINNSGATTAKSIISVRGSGADQTYSVLNVKMPKAGYFKYVLRPLTNPANSVTVKSFNFKSMSSATSKTHATNYLSSPSVHLSNWRSTDSSVSSNKKYDWCYMEILVPEGGDPLYTYYMSLGVLNGYMGIQTNSISEHAVIFSMWDDGDTDEDPTLDQKKRAGALDWDPSVTISRFGNEGTGTKSFIHGWNWNTGVPVKFLTNARLEAYNDTMKSVLTGRDSVVFRQNTLVSAWYNPSDGKGWRYISTLRLPNKISYFNSWYSFLENYGRSNGQVKRYAYYYNAFAHEAPSTSGTPRWINFNKVSFGNTDGASGQRVDFEQGRSDQADKFYMSSGGYGFTTKTENTINLQTDKSVVENLNLAAFSKRVDQAIVREKARNDSIKNITENLADKNGWTITDFSSQETSGEGAVNGRASTTIDNNASTYWHSAWLSNISSFPHYITVNMNKTENVTGFMFKLSGGTTRHQKNIELWGSTDGIKFELMLGTQAPDSEEYYIPLPKTWSISHFKVVILDSYSGQVHCRINEIDVTTSNVTTIKSNDKKITNQLAIFPNPAKDKLNFYFGNTEKNVEVTLCDISGKCVGQQSFELIVPNKLNTIDISSLNSGTYLFRINRIGDVVAQKIFVKLK